jgi:hypothetical protein
MAIAAAIARGGAGAAALLGLEIAVLLDLAAAPFAGTSALFADFAARGRVLAVMRFAGALFAAPLRVGAAVFFAAARRAGFLRAAARAAGFLRTPAFVRLPARFAFVEPLRFVGALRALPAFLAVFFFAMSAPPVCLTCLARIIGQPPGSGRELRFDSRGARR